MSKSRPPTPERDVLRLDSGIEALQNSPEFRGPVEPVDGHRCNEHMALIYEDRREQFDAIVPFIRQGLERGERCLYVVHETERDAVVDALESGGVDVDAALASGALSFHATDETYLRNGAFDPDDMIEFYGDAIEEATAEYEALRVTADTGWILDESTTMGDWMAYESRVNDLFEGEDCIALCQYDRDLIPAEILRDLVRTHPHLVYDSTVCHNFYYTPPEEFFRPDEPDREFDRMVKTLVERSRAKAELRSNRRFLQELTEVTADPDRGFEEKLRALLALGCERFDLELGGLNRVDPESDRFVVEYLDGEHEHFEPGTELPLSETYCHAAATIRDVAAIEDAAAAGYDGVRVYEEFGARTYLGTFVPVDGGPDRTVGFVGETPREEPFTREEHTYLELMGQWIKSELERRQRERFLQSLYETTANADGPFEAQVREVLELGRERFGTETGFLARIVDGAFEIVEAVGPHDRIQRGDAGSLETTYCRHLLDADGGVAVADAPAEGWADDPAYDRYGLDAYLGTLVDTDDTATWSLCFADREPTAFSDADRTYLELMAQWTGYELGRQQRDRYQRELYEITADPGRTLEGKLQALFELGRERFDLELGGVARIDPATDEFAVEHIGGEHDHLVPGARLPLSETYCRLVADGGETAAVTSPAAFGLDDTIAREEFGVETYLGTRIELDAGPDRSFFFVSSEARDEPFSDADRTFLELVGQWVRYEFERRGREDRLSALNRLARDLMDAEGADEVSEHVAAAAAESMGLPATAIALYDREAGRLRPAAASDDAAAVLDATPLLAVGEGAAWDAFVENEPRRVADPFDDAPGTPADGSSWPPVSEVAVFPLGRHGVLVTGTNAPDGFGPGDYDFAETVAANAGAALDRTHRESQLQEREAVLQEQNETLERLTRINDIIRGIDKALVGASTRAEIESVVCERLAGAGPYELAWIGEHDAVGGEVRPRESAGAAKGYLDAISIRTDRAPESGGPAARAIATGEPQVVNDFLDDAEFEPWRQDALNRGYHAGISLPVLYEGTLYGVLNVYAGQPGVFDDLERSVLAELADNVAYAINAVESKKALVSDEVVELEFSVLDPRFGVVELVEATGCEFTHESIVTGTDGDMQAFFSTRGAPAAAVRDALDALAVSGAELLAEREEDGDPVCLWEAQLSCDSLPAVVLQHGGTPRRIEAAEGDATVTVHLAHDAAVREFVDMFTTRYPDAELVAQRTRDGSDRTTTEFRAAVAEALTPRQLEVFQTAYYSGYFEQPRTRNGGEIADALGISQPTFNAHLRTAQRKLSGELLEAESLPTDR